MNTAAALSVPAFADLDARFAAPTMLRPASHEVPAAVDRAALAAALALAVGRGLVEAPERQRLPVR